MAASQSLEAEQRAAGPTVVADGGLARSAVVGVLGGGQLGKMLAMEAVRRRPRPFPATPAASLPPHARRQVVLARLRSAHLPCHPGGLLAASCPAPGCACAAPISTLRPNVRELLAGADGGGVPGARPDAGLPCIHSGPPGVRRTALLPCRSGREPGVPEQFTGITGRSAARHVMRCRLAYAVHRGQVQHATPTKPLQCLQFCERQVLGSFRDAAAVLAFAEGVDVLTVEIEHIDADAVQQV